MSINDDILDLDIVVENPTFSESEQNKFDELMPLIDYLLRHSTLEHISINDTPLPSAFYLRTFNGGKEEKTISFFQMIENFNCLNDEIFAFIKFLEGKKSRYLVCDENTRILMLMKNRLRDACLSNKDILDALSINKSKCNDEEKPSRVIAHHWDISSINNNIHFVYHVLSDCCNVADYVYSPCKTLECNHSSQVSK